MLPQLMPIVPMGCSRETHAPVPFGNSAQDSRSFGGFVWAVMHMPDRIRLTKNKFNTITIIK
jgi:hypothetical protein